MAKSTIVADPEAMKGVEAFRETIAKKAEELVFVTMPRKILSIQAKIDETQSPSSPFQTSRVATDTHVYPNPSSSESTDTKKRKLENGTGSSLPTLMNDTQSARFTGVMKSNPVVASLHEEIKKESTELVECCDTVKLWVNLTMPKIEDGDNFGVQIQEEALNELHRSQESAYNLRDAARSHYLNRAKICAKIMKYPHLEDYTRALKEIDEKAVYHARQYLIDIRNIYAVLTDIMHKNIQKIRTPKGNNRENMY